MASNRIKTLALAAAVVTCTGLGYSSVAEAHHRTMRHYGGYSGWHKAGWTHYGHMRPNYAFGDYSMGMGVAACGCAAPGYYGYAGEQGEGGAGLGAPSF